MVRAKYEQVGWEVQVLGYALLGINQMDTDESESRKRLIDDSNSAIARFESLAKQLLEEIKGGMDDGQEDAGDGEQGDEAGDERGDEGQGRGLQDAEG